VGSIRPTTKNFDTSRVDWGRLWSGFRNFRFGRVQPTVLRGFSPSTGTVALLVESSLPSDVQRKERSNGILDSISFIGTALVSNPVSLTASVSIS